MKHLHLTVSDTIATLTFDREGSSANIFDHEVLNELGEALDEIENNTSILGLIITSAKPSIFIAGADLKVLSSADTEALSQLIELGQSTFNKLADLRIPTVAAIHGACAGGGYELALACDWRIASNDPKTKIGLPETQLGILPAWGGSTRLPKLIGLPAALQTILAGKLITAASAKHKGLIDAVAPKEHLEQYAHTFIGRGKRKLKVRPFLHHRLSVFVIRKKALAQLLHKTRGLYPGVVAALEVVCHSVFSSRFNSLTMERTEILKLAQLPETKQLLRLFFLNERAKKHVYTESPPRKVERTAVIGAGVMGAGIAYWISTRKTPVILQDISHAAVAKGVQSIQKLYDASRTRRVFTATQAARGMDQIHTAVGDVPLNRCDLVIEAASEDLEIKKKIFSNLSSRTSATTVLATNTSALPIHQLAESIQHPERLLGLHFFNPVHRMPLVEVVRTKTTSDETLATGIQFIRSIGKTPVVVNDSPGFLVNRILMPYLVEASRLFEIGIPAKEIDDAMLDFGMPMGPLRLLDEVGLDVAIHVAHTLADAFPDRMNVPPLAEQLVKLNQLGRKSGKGFYTYHGANPSPNQEALSLRNPQNREPINIQQHLAALMSEEAQRCLNEQIAETAEEIDLAMVLGTGYAPFRGGPLEYLKNTTSA